MQFSPIDSSGASADDACIAVEEREEDPEDFELAPSWLLLLLYNEITGGFCMRLQLISMWAYH